MGNQNIVLASGSPRRQELLRLIGIENFRILVDSSDEDIPPGLSPEEAVCAIALKKAKNISHFCEKCDIIIAADTLVYLDGVPIAKPESENDAFNMLKSLSGRKHSVLTGIVLLKGDILKNAVEKTDVFFRELSDDEISEYIKTGEPFDKAGAYAAQGRGAVFIERIEGDFYNVMGLPLCRLTMMLREFGF
jgi:septum formation protein